MHSCMLHACHQRCCYPTAVTYLPYRSPVSLEACMSMLRAILHYCMCMHMHIYLHAMMLMDIQHYLKVL